MAMDFKTITDVLSARETAWMGLWTLFVTVSGAYLTLLASDKISFSKRVRLGIVLTILFVFFAIGNYLTLNQVRQQRELFIHYGKTWVSRNVKDETQSDLRAFLDHAAPDSEPNLQLYSGLLSLVVVAGGIALICKDKAA